MLCVLCGVQALVCLEVLEQRCNYAFYMHADDDSYVRLDLMLQLLVRLLLAVPLACCHCSCKSGKL